MIYIACLKQPQLWAEVLNSEIQISNSTWIENQWEEGVFSNDLNVFASKPFWYEEVNFSRDYKAANGKARSDSYYRDSY